MSERLNEIRVAAYLLPDPGGEVVRELVTEIDFLREELHQRDKYVDEQIERADRTGWAALVNGRNQLMAVRDEALQIHKTLHQTGSV